MGTARLVEPLSEEDRVAQSCADCSPAKWHLAHTTWFFEAMVLAHHEPGFRPHHEDFWFIFNSYYNSLGAHLPKPERGLLTRPSSAEVTAYRDDVNERVLRLLEAGDLCVEALDVLETGLHHEQQHQELILMDIKHLFSRSPLAPAYLADDCLCAVGNASLGWHAFDESIVDVGHDSADGSFAYDNESPRHRALVHAFEFADRLVTNGEFQDFIEDRGYARPELWLDAGWSWKNAHAIESPLYWRGSSRDGWREFTLRGERTLEPNEPVVHVSRYEAEAYARWAGARLPTEFEWERVCGSLPITGNLLERECMHPASAAGEQGVRQGGGIRQAFGDCWEWTSSHYSPYPGYAPPEGALGEYNGKFMSGPFILRGGCCATPTDHLRATYRNYYHPEKRWQFSGIRLARGV